MQVVTCPSCSSAIPVGAAFCPSCGRPVSAVMPLSSHPGAKFPRVATPGSLHAGGPSASSPPLPVAHVPLAPPKPSPAVVPAPVSPTAATVVSHHELPPAPPLASRPDFGAVSQPGVDRYVGKLVAGKFQVLELIGQGGMGKVYKARHVTLDKVVCLKTLKPALLADDTIVNRFEREAKSASRLDHPNSIHILDFGTDELGAMYIAMEFVDGKDLRKVLRDEFPLGEGRVCHVVSQVLAALVRAHDLGIVHRDLKPENVLVSQRPDAPDFVKVLDFGIAKILEGGGPGLTLADTICGTPEYMAPENARGEAFDQRADLYSVGVILYQLVTGTLPFEARSAMDLMRHHVETPPEPPNRRRPGSCSPALESLILKAMSKDPAKRPQSAREFREQLVAIGREARNKENAGTSDSIPPAVRTRPPSRAPEPSPSFDSDPALDVIRPSTNTPAIVIGFVAVALVAAGAFWAFQPPPEPPPPPPPDPVKLAVNEAVRVINSKQADVNACFRKTNTKINAESGSLVLSIVIGADGEVESSAILESTVKAPKLATCLMNAVATWKFDAPPVEHLQVKYTYNFRRG